MSEGEERPMERSRRGSFLNDALEGLAAAAKHQGLGAPPRNSPKPAPILKNGPSQGSNERLAETGEVPQSLMHPLSSDSDKGDTGLPSTHQRGVSWGEPSKAAEEQATAAPPEHERVISWGAVEPPASLCRTNSRGHRKTTSTMQAVLEHSPLETEAEEQIIRALEQIDPIRPEPTMAQTNILPGVLDDATKDLSLSTPTLPVLKKSHRRVKSTAEKLFDLTNDFNLLQGEQETKADDQRRRGSVMQSLAVKAAQLDHRNSEVLHGHPLKASSRWQQVKQSLGRQPSVNGGMVVPPASGKTDSEQVLDTFDLDEDEENGGKNDAEQGMKRPVYRQPLPQKKRTFKHMEAWLHAQGNSVMNRIKMALLITVPAALLAALLFYALDNPPCTQAHDCEPETILRSPISSFFVGSLASVSWWLLFLLVRQVITFQMALVLQFITVEVFSTYMQKLTGALGASMVLFVLQGQGWPMILFYWASADFATLYGENRFAKHWLYWQEPIRLFNEHNPAGIVTESSKYRGALVFAMVLGVAVAIKRCWLSVQLGKKTFERYGEDLARVIEKKIIVGNVAALARDIEDSGINLADFGLHCDPDYYDDGNGDGDNSVAKESTMLGLLDGVDLSSRRQKVEEILGEWEQPPEDEGLSEDPPSIACVIQFRQSLSCLNTEYPFSVAFGKAGTRHDCCHSAEQVYERLLLGSPASDVLSFDTLALLAVRPSGELDEDTLRDLVRLFRPNRDGSLSLLDFAKSADSVYKEFRLLRAAIHNSSKLDKSFESVFNIIFYPVLVLGGLFLLGIDTFTVYSGFQTFLIGYVFLIGATASTMFEGVIMILFRKPYDVGDRIDVSQPNDPASVTGSSTWIVKDISLLTTTVVFGATSEVATISNGYLNPMRIINYARSPRPSILMYFKFPINVDYKLVQVFKSANEKFVRDRPREWVKLGVFRVTRVEADLGYVEYVLGATHRDTWQNIGAVLTSKAELMSFALEVTKKLKIRYTAPAMPVNLNVNHPTDHSAMSSLLHSTRSMEDPPAHDFTELAEMLARK